MKTRAIGVLVLAALAGCASPRPEPEPVAPLLPSRDAYLKPDRTDDGKLQYTEDYDTFAPFMTKRTGYPTQRQAQTAFLRSKWYGMPFKTVVTAHGVNILKDVPYEPEFPAQSIRIFACSPGALDGVTGRNVPSTHPLVHCASDLLDGHGRKLARVPLNFYYTDNVWRLHDPNPRYQAPLWRTYEPSPKRSRGLIGDRY